MAEYHTFTTARTTPPDPIALADAVRSATGDATAVLGDRFGQWRGKKVTTWTAQQIANVQTSLDTVAALTPQLEAQRAIDRWPLELQAAFILVMEQFNVLRAFHGLPAFTRVQFINAIRDKAATLS